MNFNVKRRNAQYAFNFKYLVLWCMQLDAVCNTHLRVWIYFNLILIEINICISINTTLTAAAVAAAQRHVPIRFVLFTPWKVISSISTHFPRPSISLWLTHSFIAPHCLWSLFWSREMLFTLCNNNLIIVLRCAGAVCALKSSVLFSADFLLLCLCTQKAMKFRSTRKTLFFIVKKEMSSYSVQYENVHRRHWLMLSAQTHAGTHRSKSKDNKMFLKRNYIVREVRSSKPTFNDRIHDFIHSIRSVHHSFSRLCLRHDQHVDAFDKSTVKFEFCIVLVAEFLIPNCFS